MPLPGEFAANARLRARCISGCLTLEGYLAALTNSGFGRVDVRARFPYRYLHPVEYPEINEPVMLESIEVAAYKVPDGPDGPEVFTGRTATYFGPDTSIREETGFTLARGIPTPVSDAAAARLAKRSDFVVTEPTFHSKGGGCC